MSEKEREAWKRGYEIGLTIGMGKAKTVEYKAACYDRLRMEVDELKKMLRNKLFRR